MIKKDIEWVLSKVCTQEYFLDDCHYMARILSEESENNAKDIFINRYFSLTMRGVPGDNQMSNIFQECIDKKKIWTLLEKNFGAICIKLPEASINNETYLFVFGPNKKCPEITNTDSFAFFSQNEIKKPRKENSLELSSLRLAE